MSNTGIRRSSAARRGLTLIELVVVMLILAALAGLILPLLPSMITRAHTSSGATNIGEIAKAVQTHEQLYQGYPNKLDSLVDPDSAGDVLGYVPGYDSTDFGVNLTLTAEQVEALEHAGITHVTTMVNAPAPVGDFNPTFFPYGANAAATPTPALLTATTSEVAQLTGLAAAREFGTSATATYVVFGLGRFSSMQGKTMQEAPVHFSDHQGQTPNNSYARYGVVFQLTDDAGAEELKRARFVGVVAFHGSGVAGAGSHIAEYHEAAE